MHLVAQFHWSQGLYVQPGYVYDLYIYIHTQYATEKTATDMSLMMMMVMVKMILMMMMSQDVQDVQDVER